MGKNGDNANKSEKTNVMRLLDEAGIVYEHVSYSTQLVNAAEVAESVGRSYESVFKTLVTVGKSGAHYVFMLPSRSELDLKKAAKAAGEKSVEMIPQKQLLPLTGYIHGGCSPIGMKKRFPTFADESLILLDQICFSAGKVGFQVVMTTNEFMKAVNPVIMDLCKRR